MTNFAISQALIVIAFLFDLVSFQIKRRKYILICLTCASTLIGTHFILLNNLTAACLSFIAGTRFLVASFSKNKLWLYFFIIVTVLLFTYTYFRPLSLFALSASILASIASFQSNDKRLRLTMMLCTSLWIFHNILAKTPAAVALESFFLCSNLIGYYRFYVANNSMEAHASKSIVSKS